MASCSQGFLRKDYGHDMSWKRQNRDEQSQTGNNNNEMSNRSRKLEAGKISEAPEPASLLIRRPPQQIPSWAFPDAEIQIIREDGSRPARGILLSSLIPGSKRRGDWIDGRKIDYYRLIRDLLANGDFSLRESLWWNHPSFDVMETAQIAGPHPHEVQVTSDNFHSIIWEGISLRHRHLRCPTPDLDGIRPLVPRPRFTIVIRDPDAVGGPLW